MGESDVSKLKEYNLLQFYFEVSKSIMETGAIGNAWQLERAEILLHLIMIRLIFSESDC